MWKLMEGGRIGFENSLGYEYVSAHQEIGHHCGVWEDGELALSAQNQMVPAELVIPIWNERLREWHQTICPNSIWSR